MGLADVHQQRAEEPAFLVEHHQFGVGDVGCDDLVGDCGHDPGMGPGRSASLGLRQLCPVFDPGVPLIADPKHRVFPH